MTTLEGNKLIADFMGAKYDKDTAFPIHPDDLWLPVHGIVTWAHDRGKRLKYDNSWEWLMPVIAKIAHDCEEPEELDGIKYAMFADDIDTAWEYVIDLIKEAAE